MDTIFPPYMIDEPEPESMTQCILCLFLLFAIIMVLLHYLVPPEKRRKKKKKDNVIVRLYELVLSFIFKVILKSKKIYTLYKTKGHKLEKDTSFLQSDNSEFNPFPVFQKQNHKSRHVHNRNPPDDVISSGYPLSMCLSNNLSDVVYALKVDSPPPDRKNTHSGEWSDTSTEHESDMPASISSYSETDYSTHSDSMVQHILKQNHLLSEEIKILKQRVSLIERGGK